LSNVYPAKTNIEKIIDQESPDFRNTFYLVDPGKTRDDCTPSDTFLVNMILNAAADDRHWGGPEFRKRRTSHRAQGRILTFPMMTKAQIFQARTLFLNYPDEETLEKRHHNFGNIPRFLFEADEEDCQAQIIAQDKALAPLTAKQARDILFNLAELNSNKATDPP
jgi:hypothetical protein